MTDVNTDRGVLLEALNHKADLDLNNAAPSSTFGKQSAWWAMPSDQYIDTSFIRSTVGTYTWTAPANGYFSFTGVCGTGGSSVALYIGSSLVDKNSSAGHHFGLCWPCKKGDTIKVIVNDSTLYALSSQVFYYAQGEI